MFSLRASNIAIVLDNSASMQTLENQQTRFALAQEKARELLADLSATGQVDLYLTAPRLEKVRGTTFEPSEAAGVLTALTPYDLADTPIDYQRSLSQMAKERNYDRVFLITDHPAAGQTDTLRVITVGRPRDNFAVSSFNISHASLVGARLEATAEVANFSTNDERIRIALRGGGAVISSRELSVDAGKTAQATSRGFPAYPYYEVEIEVRDALPLDNRRFAVPPAAQNLRILGISPRPQALSSLRSIAGVSLDVIAPQEYNKIDRSGYGLEIFHYAAPPCYPELQPFLCFHPTTTRWSIWRKPVSRPTVSGWREPHPLTRYVNFALLRPSFSRPLRPRVSGETIIESPMGPLVFATAQRGASPTGPGLRYFPLLRARKPAGLNLYAQSPRLVLSWFSGGQSYRRTVNLQLYAARKLSPHSKRG